jgi:hypothetical protein
MKRSRLARGKRSLRQSPEITSTSASPIRCSSAAPSRVEALDAGRERQEALAEPIGNMRKTDSQLVLGRDTHHRWGQRTLSPHMSPAKPWL